MTERESISLALRHLDGRYNSEQLIREHWQAARAILAAAKRAEDVTVETETPHR